jgi:hypothetical protein
MMGMSDSESYEIHRKRYKLPYYACMVIYHLFNIYSCDTLTQVHSWVSSSVLPDSSAPS